MHSTNEVQKGGGPVTDIHVLVDIRPSVGEKTLLDTF